MALTSSQLGAGQLGAMQLGAGAGEEGGSAPTVVTGTATLIASNGADAHGTVNPNGSLVTFCKVQLGLTTAYGTNFAIGSPGEGSSPAAVEVWVGSSLSPSTTYHYRVAATNAFGTTYGEDQTFKTLAEEEVEPEAKATPATGLSTQSVEVTVRLQALDGTWETCGADRAIGVIPETLTLSSNEWGFDKASFDLHRSPIAMWPDLGAFTPVEVEVGGVVVWEGRIGQTPLKMGSEQIINVQCEGWQYHLDDDVYQRVYVHSKLSDWKDSRSMLNALLGVPNGYCAGGTVASTNGVITLAWPESTAWPELALTGATLDLGPASSAAMVEVDYLSSQNDGELSVLMIYGSATDSLDAADSAAVFNGTAASETMTLTFAAARRYISVLLRNNTVARTAAKEVWFKIKAVRVYAATAYESGNASVLHASTIVLDALERGTMLLSGDHSQIGATSFAIPDFTLSKASTPREAIEAANAYHNWIAKLLTGRRMQFKERPTAPLLEIGAWSGSEVEDASANSGAEIYNRALIEASGADGSPLLVERAASVQPGVLFVVSASPVPDNPSFTTNTTSWTAGAGTLTRDTTVSHSAPASGKMVPTGAPTLTETFTGTFKRSVLYQLSFAILMGAGTLPLTATFGTATDNGSLSASVLAAEGWRILSVTWTPQKDATGVTLVLHALETGEPETFWVDDLTLVTAEPTLVDRRRFRRTKVIQMSSAITATEGNQLGDVFLQGHMTTPFKGSVAVTPGGTRTVLGGQAVHPSTLLLRTQELLRLSHLVDPDSGGVAREGTIAEVTYTHRDQKAQVVLDDKRANFDALLSRLQVVQGVGS